MKNSLTLITGSSKTRQALSNQLTQLLEEYITINSYAIDEGEHKSFKDEIILFSSEAVKAETEKFAQLSAKQIIVGKRTLNHENVDKLLRIEEGTKVLVVNDDFQSTVELIQSLYQLGINHLEYFPFKSDQLYYPDINFSVSPGETHLSPPYIKHVLDIGVRLFDISTILHIVDYFHFNDNIATLISEKYLRNIIELHRELFNADQSVKKVNRHIQSVVNTVDDGILAIDGYKRITVLNDRIIKLFKLTKSNYEGKYIDEIIKEQNIRDFILNGTDESKFFSIDNIDIVIYRTYSHEDDRIVATFKSVNQAFEIEKTAQREFRKQGFYARYDFADIIGEDDAILECKRIATKLAKAEHPILIQGETGTGKELFAHAIHKHSNRKNGPFLAINCSAFTESLLESELFGYEDGTFTGAKKGGKQGLFEIADGGTIFLDEIGDISLNVQSHLLRVLQEQEIRRIGGRKIIPINVRIIAATNKDIHHKISDGSFRSDLYYRLNVLNLIIPPLRLRRTDIPMLVQHFISKSGKGVSIEKEALNELMGLNWLGNIRELKSVIDYMLTVCEGNTISRNDFPHYNYTENREQPKRDSDQFELPTSVLEIEESVTILETIKNCNDLGKAASRDLISNSSEEKGRYLSPQQIRLRLEIMGNKGLITKGRGRAGTKITTIGIDYLHLLKANMKNKSL
ncbi:Fis family transcriptional regulator [Gottfriedia luciferensis]|uniref:Fis family transcriptional regulator n=1 Tax=Gottfriedia luciferensis TaxID=178774 RepID=A0ABX2ZXW2_9BACI|nr:sigma 54-interacting transcriptional regulator [Gottfriedia luciferensis]ODG93219.1 Fis family transcriptional regulator [Gottfriedia luciferensis]